MVPDRRAQVGELERRTERVLLHVEHVGRVQASSWCVPKNVGRVAEADDALRHRRW